MYYQPPSIRTPVRFLFGKNFLFLTETNFSSYTTRMVFHETVMVSWGKYQKINETKRPPYRPDDVDPFTMPVILWAFRKMPLPLVIIYLFYLSVQPPLSFKISLQRHDLPGRVFSRSPSCREKSREPGKHKHSADWHFSTSCVIYTNWRSYSPSCVKKVMYKKFSGI